MRVPFRDVPYAEDHQLALDMLRAGYAKVFVPGAAVEHSHEYSPRQLLRRCFDEWRGAARGLRLRRAAARARVRDQVLVPAHADVRWARARGDAHAARSRARRWRCGRLTTRAHAGAALGSRHDRLPARVRRRLSLESRATFVRRSDRRAMTPGDGMTRAHDPHSILRPDAEASTPDAAIAAMPRGPLANLRRRIALT